MHYVKGIDALADGDFGLVVDGQPTTLRFTRGQLEQIQGRPRHAKITVHTTSAFMDRWAAGDVTWDDGLASGEVTTTGSRREWEHWLAATGYLLSYEAR